ncbi:MAG: hypothetical protein ACLR0P_13585 [Oscillospiraceae bacterium]
MTCHCPSGDGRKSGEPQLEPHASCWRIPNWIAAGHAAGGWRWSWRRRCCWSLGRPVPAE